MGKGRLTEAQIEAYISKHPYLVYKDGRFVFGKGSYADYLIKTYRPKNFMGRVVWDDGGVWSDSCQVRQARIMGGFSDDISFAQAEDTERMILGKTQSVIDRNDFGVGMKCLLNNDVVFDFDIGEARNRLEGETFWWKLDVDWVRPASETDEEYESAKEFVETQLEERCRETNFDVKKKVQRLKEHIGYIACDRHDSFMGGQMVWWHGASGTGKTTLMIPIHNALRGIGWYCDDFDFNMASNDENGFYCEKARCAKFVMANDWRGKMETSRLLNFIDGRAMFYSAKKGKDATPFHPFFACVVASNNPPVFSDNDGGAMKRRITTLSLNNPIPKDQCEYVVNRFSNDRAVQNYFLKECLKAFADAVKRGCWTAVEGMDERDEEIMCESSDGISGWCFDNFGTDKPVFDGCKSIRELYENYLAWKGSEYRFGHFSNEAMRRFSKSLKLKFGAFGLTYGTYNCDEFEADEFHKKYEKTGRKSVSKGFKWETGGDVCQTQA